MSRGKVSSYFRYLANKALPFNLYLDLAIQTKMLRRSNIIIFVTLAFILSVNISSAAPTSPMSSTKYIVGYSNFTTAYNNTVTGFVTFVALGDLGTTVT